MTVAVEHNAAWLRNARLTRALSWASLLWMTLEGGVGVVAGIGAHSIGLIGWALSSGVEGLASVIVIWRFTGSRTHSHTSEERAQKFVAVSFFLLAPYIAAQAVADLLHHNEVTPSTLGFALLASSIVFMPSLGYAKRRLGRRLDSKATAGEGTQNLLCAATAAAVIVGLAGQSLFGAWWLDPLAAFAVAAVAVRDGVDMWRGDPCCD